MSEFLTQSALAQRLVEKTGVSAETAKNFSTLFFTIVRKGLKDTDTFSVYNFGTFKKTWIEQTTGLNPQTGVKIEIPAHWRIKFVPCSSVARRINRPYAHLKPKIIKEPKNQKVGSDGLYAKASQFAFQSDKEKTEENKDAENAEDQTIVLENANANVNAASEAPSQNSQPAPQDEEKMGLLAAAENLRAENAIKEAEEDVPSEESYEPAVIENDDPDEYDDDDEVEEKEKKPVKVLLLAGAAIVIIVLLIALLVRACSSKPAKPAAEKDTDDSHSVPELVVEDEKQPEVEPEPEPLSEPEPEPEPIVEKEVEPEPAPEPEPVAEEPREVSYEDYVVPSGGCFHSIAEEKYSNRHLWPLIYSANKSKYPDPDFVGSYGSIKIPEKPTGEAGKKQIAAAMLDAYNGYLLMCEKQPDSPKNEERRNRAVRVIVSGELIQEGFIEENKARIMPDYAEAARKILKTSYGK